jgi:hypothetical protein
MHGVAGASSCKRILADGTVRRYTLNPVRYYECFICNMRINAKWLETLFRDQVESLAARPQELRKWVQSEPFGSTRRDVEREITRLAREYSEDALERRQKQVWDLALEAKIDSKDLSEQLKRVKDEFARHQKQLSNLREQLTARTMTKRTQERAAELLKNFWKLYDAASYEDRRELITATVRALGGATATRDGIVWERQPAAQSTRSGDRRVKRGKRSL